MAFITTWLSASADGSSSRPTSLGTVALRTEESIADTPETTATPSVDQRRRRVVQRGTEEQKPASGTGAATCAHISVVRRSTASMNMPPTDDAEQDAERARRGRRVRPPRSTR